MPVNRGEGGSCDRCGSRIVAAEGGLQLVHIDRSKVAAGEEGHLCPDLSAEPVAQYCHKCSGVLMLGVSKECNARPRTTIGITGYRATAHLVPLFSVLSGLPFEHVEIEDLRNEELLLTLVAAGRDAKRYTYDVVSRRYYPVADT